MEQPIVERVRSFNRTVTEGIGVLDDHFLGRGRPLGESRILWEIGVDGTEVRALRSLALGRSLLTAPKYARCGSGSASIPGTSAASCDRSRGRGSSQSVPAAVTAVSDRRH